MNLDRSLRMLALVVAIWSFTSLVATGQLSLSATFIPYAVFAILIFRGDLFRRIPTRAWTVANLLLLAGSVICVIYGSSNLGTTLVYGTVYLQIQILARYKRPRDHMGLFLLSFFQVVLSAAISVEFSFAIAMTVFLGLAMLALALLTLERNRLEVERNAARTEGVGRLLALEGEGIAKESNRKLSAGIGGNCLPANYALRMAAVSAIVIGVSVVFFVAIPRLAVRKVFMRLRPFETENITGFSDQVLLGGLGEIAANRAVVMRVWVASHLGEREAAPTALRLRGVALDFFDRSKWVLSPFMRNRTEMIRGVTSAVHVPVPFAANPSRHVQIVAEQDMQQVRWLFGPPFIAELDQFDYTTDLLFYPGSHAFRAIGLPRDMIRYRALAYVEPPFPTILTSTASARPPGSDPQEPPSQEARKHWILSERERESYLQIPSSLFGRDRLRVLADEVTRGAQTPLERLSRLNRFFHDEERFHYALATEETDPTHTLVQFLFEERKGHCETFATAMAILCRMAGVPARVVNGFYTTEFNRYESFFYVRQNHTHAWVEVWLDGFGWMTVDPTPPSALAGDNQRFTLLRILGDYWDAWTVRWRHYVVDYSLTDQWGFFLRLRALMTPRLHFSPRRSVPFRYALHNWIIQARKRGQERRYTLHTVSLAGLIVGWVFYRRHQRRNGNRQAKHKRAVLCSVPFYAQVLAALVREGWQRRLGQTPAEFARAVSTVRMDLAHFPAVTDAYYRVRFSGGQLDPSEQVCVNALLAHLYTNQR